jgi:pimeloyl-ACP methyl ester carboxylesterase
MWRWTRRILIGVVALIVAASVCGASYQAWATNRDLAAHSPPGKLVDVGGHRLHIWCAGSGAPSVLLDSGLGGTAFDWGHVQPEVAKFTQVCSYDRAGMGYSDSGPRPRTSQQTVRELVALLDKSGVSGRVVLVGASIGGWNVRLFASQHENRVAGLVLVDARHEDQGQRLSDAGAAENPPAIAHIAPVVAYLGIARVLGVAPGQSLNSYSPSLRRFVEATRYRSSALVTAASELLHGKESEDQVRRARRSLSIPVIVVSAGRRREDGHVAELLNRLQRDQLSLSQRSCQIMAQRSGHAIAIAQPEIVVDAIRAVVDVSRQPDAAPNCAAITQRGPELGASAGR